MDINIHGYIDRGKFAINLACLDLIYWLVRSSRECGKDEWMGFIVILASCELYNNTWKSNDAISK